MFTFLHLYCMSELKSEGILNPCPRRTTTQHQKVLIYVYLQFKSEFKDFNISESPFNRYQQMQQSQCIKPYSQHKQTETHHIFSENMHYQVFLTLKDSSCNLIGSCPCIYHTIKTRLVASGLIHSNAGFYFHTESNSFVF